MVLGRGGVFEAALAAKKAGCAVQLLPLATPGLGTTDGFEEFLEQLKAASIEVVSYEDRWGGNNPLHPWTHDLMDGKLSAVPAYYLLFPWRYSDVLARVALLREYFPRAVAVDLTNGPLEISPHQGNFNYWYSWLETPEAKKRGVVIDTFHLREFASAGRGSKDSMNYAMRLMARVRDHDVPVKLIHVQFRDQLELNGFTQGTSSQTTHLLQEVQQILRQTPSVVLELDPSLVTTSVIVGLQNRIDLDLDLAG